MKGVFIFYFFCSTLSCICYAQNKWSSIPFEQKVFVENKGQFDDKVEGRKDILFQTVSNGVEIYITKNGIIYQRIEKKLNPKISREHKSKEERSVLETHNACMNLVGSNGSAMIDPKEKSSFYYTYGYSTNEEGPGIISCAFKKILIKNIYSNIDIEYSLPEDSVGIKYTFILHPGANPDDIKIKWESDSVFLDEKNNISIHTPFGKLIDHSPIAYYLDNFSSLPVKFSLTDSFVSFDLSDRDKNRVLIMDPWISSPTFAWNKAFDVGYDYSGNVYAYGSFNPFQLVKFNSSGTLQWIFNATPFTGTFFNYGDFTVDGRSGSCYLTEGYRNGNAGARILKVNTNGLQVALSPGAANMREIWRIDFDYCNNKLVAGGGSPVPFQNHAFSADTNLASISPIVLASTVPANHEGHDIALLEVDKYAPFAYMLFARETTGNLSLDNYLVQCPTPNLLPLANGYNTNHNFIEIATAIYYGSLFSAISNGYNGIAVSPTHVYTYDGVDLKKWNKTGTFNGGFNLPFNAPVLWGGLAVDICNNLYVGIGKDIRVYNSSLALINTISQPDSVYDIKLWPGGAKLYASGKGFVSEVTLPLVPSATISLSSTSSSCSGCTGTTSVSITACSVLSYTYSWMSGGQTTSTVTGLCPGTYTVNIFSNCNLIHTGTISVTGGGSLTLSPAQTNVLCNGGNTGSATITSSGGVAPYTYSWSPSGGSASTATGLSAGNYSVTITDGTGCLNMQVFTITQPPVITTTITATQTACGGNNGSASVIAAGGTGSYTYLWNPSTSSTSSSTGLSAGNYTVAIFDANNCTGTATVNVTSSGGPSVALANQTNVLCNGENTGAATVTAAGGSQPYTYNWSNGQTTSAAMTLNSGSYSVVVSDASGCSSVFSVIITQPSILTAAVSSTSSACAMNNGTAAIIPSGGNPSYSYLWSNGQTSSVASTLAGGTYSVMITDGNGCTLTTTVFVSQTGGPTAIAGTTATILQGSSTTLSASGAATYSWVPSAGLSCTTCPTPAASPSQTTEYCVHVYDASGCYDSACVTIFVITVVEPIDCSTTSMGDILLPNAFSPNGDSENDALKILCNAMECIETLTISIYNRWGEEVFKSDDRYFEWSGIYKGKPENSGVFAYMMKVKLVSGEEVTRNGNVSLIR